MANSVLWTVVQAYTTAIVGTSSGLRNMANDARVLGSAINNDSQKAIRAAFELYIKFQSNPSANGYMALYLIEALDNTNYADGDASTVPAPNTLKLVFPVQPNTNQQRIALDGVEIPPYKFKALLENKAGQTTTNANDTDNILSITTYAPQVQ